MSTNTKNQTNRILRYLRTGRGITAISALTRFGCMRLAARIEELRTPASACIAGCCGAMASGSPVTRSDFSGRG
jgi:hypothetical protein